MNMTGYSRPAKLADNDGPKYAKLEYVGPDVDDVTYIKITRHPLGDATPSDSATVLADLLGSGSNESALGDAHYTLTDPTPASWDGVTPGTPTGYSITSKGTAVAARRTNELLLEAVERVVFGDKDDSVYTGRGDVALTDDTDVVYLPVGIEDDGLNCTSFDAFTTAPTLP